MSSLRERDPHGTPLCQDVSKSVPKGRDTCGQLSDRRRSGRAPAPSSSSPSVAVLVPHEREVPASFALALRGLDVPGHAAFIGTNVRPIDAARNRLARLALESGATWALWLDSDTVPPPDLLRRLMALRAPFAAGVYAMEDKGGKTKVSAYVRGEQGYHAMTAPYAKDPVVEVDGIGFGCVLTHMDLFRKTPEPWFSWTYGKHAEGVGEDFFFCERVLEALKVRPVVDLTLRVGHVKARTMWPEEWSAAGAASVAALPAEHA